MVFWNTTKNLHRMFKNRHLCIILQISAPKRRKNMFKHLKVQRRMFQILFWIRFVNFQPVLRRHILLRSVNCHPVNCWPVNCPPVYRWYVLLLSINMSPCLSTCEQPIHIVKFCQLSTCKILHIQFSSVNCRLVNCRPVNHDTYC